MEPLIEYTIKIVPDDDPFNPRENDNLGVMYCGHRRYHLGDKQFHSTDEADEHMREVEKEGAEILPIYMYDHSGVTIRHYPFECQWDSGLVGWIYATKQAIRENFGVKVITKKIRERARKVLLAEIEEYDKYLRGDAYGFQIEKNGEFYDACYGFDDPKYCLKRALTCIPKEVY